jgi:hypothetical protein
MIKVAVIGLDTSHTIQFCKRIHDPDCPKGEKVPGLKVTSCLKVKTPFLSWEGLKQREQQLQKWGVNVTTDIDTALKDCDAVMLEINDGSLHYRYFKKIAELKKPVFIDKPLATDLNDARRIIKLAQKKKIRIWSGSSIPLGPKVKEITKGEKQFVFASVYGRLAKAAAGDSLIWYGVHVFELLQKLLGTGATSVQAVENKKSIITAVSYKNGAEGIVQTVNGLNTYGGYAQYTQKGSLITEHFTCDRSQSYTTILKHIKLFFRGKPAPVDIKTTFEGLALMIAARKSINTGKRERVRQL